MGEKNINQVIEDLKKEFPKISGIKDMSEWSSTWADRKGEAIFLGDCAEGGLIDGISACDYYSWEHDPEESIYIMGVHVKLVAFLKKNGLFAECHDPGTYCAFSLL